MLKRYQRSFMLSPDCHQSALRRVPSPMKLSVFLPTLIGGGAQKMMLNLIKGFAKERLEVDLIVNRRNCLRSEVPESVNLIAFDFDRLLYATPELASYLRKEKPSLMLSTLARANLSVIMASCLTDVDTKIVVRQDNHPWRHSLSENSYSSYALPPLMFLFYRFADGVISISEGLEDHLTQRFFLPESKVKTIYNPSLSGDITEKAQESVEHPWFKDHSPPVVIGMGRLTNQKNFPLLIRAFKNVREERECRLVILGKGNRRRELKDLTARLGLEKDVWMPGHVENPYKYLERSDVFAQTSRHEGFGNALLEALYLGLPVISTDCPFGPGEILNDGRYGDLVPEDDVGALASALDENLRGGEAPQVPDSFFDQFTVDSATRAYLDYFEELIE